MSNDGPAPRRRGRARALSLDDVFAAACRVMDRSGPDSVAIRSVADELGIHPTSLYVYVDNREQLVRMVAQRLFAQCLDEIGPPEATRVGVVRIFATYRLLFVRHPRLVRATHTVEMPDITESLLPSTDAVVRYLLESGLTDQQAIRVYAALMRFTIGSAWLEHNASPGDIQAHVALVKKRLKRPGQPTLDGARLFLRNETALLEVNFERDLLELLDRLTDRRT